MFIDSFLSGFKDKKSEPALIWNDRIYSYAWLDEKISEWKLKLLHTQKLSGGEVCAFSADFSPTSIALFFALIDLGCILAPLRLTACNKDELVRISQSEISILLRHDDTVEFKALDSKASHPLYARLRELRHPGLVVFSSGSTGKFKAPVHDFVPLLEKFKKPRPALRSIAFLMFDHLGGLNTMFHILSSGGCLVTVSERNLETILSAIQRHRVELLPTSPTFLNWMLLTESHRNFDLSSLRTISYGTEPMSETSLKKLHEIFPQIKLQQTYGLSELGVFRAQSKASDSLWVRIGGDGVEHRVVEGLLQIKSRAMMLGYLNAESPLTSDGWFQTYDAVEEDGDYLKILGRKSEVINVGGEKIYPSEVEDVLESFENVADAVVFGEKNVITGQAVHARISLKDKLTDFDERTFIKNLKKYCREHLSACKVPVKVEFTETHQIGERMKKLRDLSSLRSTTNP